ncbi:MAG: PsiF family protein [bacterium]
MRRRSNTWLLALLALSLCAAPAAAQTAQQKKMQSCSVEANAKQLSGEARKQFMSQCLSKDSGNSQQVRMRACNAQAKAKALSGTARKDFMKSCLSNAALAPAQPAM